MTDIEKIIAIQHILGVFEDGDIGFKTRAAFDDLDLAGNKEAVQGLPARQTLNSVSVSSFADPADIAAFQRCKRTGRSDISCFAEGDNGIGQFGKLTAQEEVAMVAVHGNEMVARWGSIQGSAHKQVSVTVNGKTIIALVEDRISAKGRIDLNPAAAKQLGLSIPIDPATTKAVWSWL